MTAKTIYSKVVESSKDVSDLVYIISVVEIYKIGDTKVTKPVPNKEKARLKETIRNKNKKKQIFIRKENFTCVPFDTRKKY